MGKKQSSRMNKRKNNGRNPRKSNNTLTNMCMTWRSSYPASVSKGVRNRKFIFVTKNALPIERLILQTDHNHTPFAQKYPKRYLLPRSERDCGMYGVQMTDKF